MKDPCWAALVFAIIFLCISLIFYIAKGSGKVPYRGKTTLEITYRDSVAIDSTVVYKVK